MKLPLKMPAPTDGTCHVLGCLEQAQILRRFALPISGGRDLLGNSYPPEMERTITVSFCEAHWHEVDSLYQIVKESWQIKAIEE